MSTPALLERRLAETPATPHQRLYIRCTLQQLQFDFDVVDDDNVELFHAAGIDEPPIGMRMDAVLLSLRRGTANKLMAVLKARSP